MSIKAGYITYFSVEVSVPKREGQYIGEIEMETEYEVSEFKSAFLTLEMAICHFRNVGVRPTLMILYSH